MKYTNKFLGALCLAAFGFASCADDYSLLDYEGIEKPVDMAAYEYLKDYNDLKSYVDRSASPNFKLGTGITASEYNEGGLVQRLAVNNFDEVTPGNAMKHESVVGNDGSMNFGTVSDFVSNARAAGQTIYGHTLLWHAQQNTKYLNSLIAPQIIKPEKPAGGNGGYALTFSNENTSGNIWDQQAQTTTATTSVAGKTYVLKMMIKGSDDGEIAA
ncbi:MAG: endo-1,4-beta-xylanase, partial [Bacteroides sp.]|nr:endo-1,4-beta-xylanase [Bacteroides sp.]